MSLSHPWQRHTQHDRQRPAEATMDREQVGTDVHSTGCKAFLAVTVEDQLCRVEDSHILTPAGISASIAMALRVVACY